MSNGFKTDRQKVFRETAEIQLSSRLKGRLANKNERGWKQATALSYVKVLSRHRLGSTGNISVKFGNC
jgi:hypothetical protein